jgi:hypothetical protein
MVRLNVRFDVGHGLRDIPIKHISNHSAMSDRLGILAGDEPQHAVPDILRRIRPPLAVFDDVQALAFHAEINVFSRDRWNKYDVLSAKFFTYCRFQLDQLGVNLKHQPTGVAVLSEGATQRNRNIVFLIVRSRRRHSFPRRYDQSENVRHHRVD